MPELPEVETVRRGLATAWEGRRFTRVTCHRGDLRAPFPEGFAQTLTGRTVTMLDRRAKYLLIHLSGDLVLIIHLGMSGRMIIGGSDDTPLGPHDHVVFVADNGVRVTFTDPRRFGLMTLCPTDQLPHHPLLAGLGPEPLADEFDGGALAASLAGKATSIKAALMDQRVVSGLGNIYVCESLFRAGIRPTRAAGALSKASVGRLRDAIRAVLDEAITAGGSTLRDHRTPNGELGYFQHHFAVYDREGEACPGCTCDIAKTGGIHRIVQSGRSTFYCPTRQK